MNRATIAALSAYLLLASTRWILDAVFPSSLPSSEASIIASLALCIAVLFFRSGSRLPDAPLLRRGRVLGALCFACAWVLSDLVGVGLPGFTRLALFSLVPVGVVVIAAARGAGQLDFLSLLGASMAGVGGMFLLLPADPEALSRKPAAALAVLAAVAALSLGSYFVYSAVRDLPARAATLLVLVPVMIVQAVSVLARHQRLLLPGYADLPGLAWQAAEIALLLSLLRTVAPVPLAARFLLVPLLGAAGAFVAMRPPLTWRLGLGAALLLFAAIRLLRERAEERDSALSLL